MRLFFKTVLLVIIFSMVELGCDQMPEKPKKSVSAKQSLPPAGQVIRDAKNYILYKGEGLIKPTNFKVEKLYIDEYEKDLCHARVSYTFASLTGRVALSYRLSGTFWKCTGVRDLGLK